MPPAGGSAGQPCSDLGGHVLQHLQQSGDVPVVVIQMGGDAYGAAANTDMDLGRCKLVGQTRRQAARPAQPQKMPGAQSRGCCLQSPGGGFMGDMVVAQAQSVGYALRLPLQDLLKRCNRHRQGDEIRAFAHVVPPGAISVAVAVVQ